MKIFSGTSNEPLTKKIAKELKIKLSPLEIHIFPDGEKRVRILNSVIGENCFVVQSCSPPVDSHYMELFFIVDALKRAGAKSITTVISYLGYQRQDHLFRSGEAVSLDIIVKTLEAVGVNKLITLDLHSIKIPEFFHIPLLHLSALSVFAKEIKKIINESKDNILISPDAGGIRRVKLLSEMLNFMPYAIILKSRDLSTGEITASKIEGLGGIDLKEIRRAFIIDDMISSGGTIVLASNLLKERGVKEVFVFATHPVFSIDAPKILSQNKSIKKVFVTDTVYLPKEKQFPKLKILSVAGVIAKAI